MADDEDNFIDIEDDEEDGENKVSILLKRNQIFLLLQGEGMDIDLNKAMKDCEGIEKVQERTNAGVVS